MNFNTNNFKRVKRYHIKMKRGRWHIYLNGKEFFLTFRTIRAIQEYLYSEKPYV